MRVGDKDAVVYLMRGARHHHSGVDATNFSEDYTASELNERLVGSGYVTREPDPNDRRRQTLTLTAKANDVLRRLSTIRLTEIRDMAPGLIEVLSDL